MPISAVLCTQPRFCRHGITACLTADAGMSSTEVPNAAATTTEPPDSATWPQRSCCLKSTLQFVSAPSAATIKRTPCCTGQALCCLEPNWMVRSKTHLQLCIQGLPLCVLASLAAVSAGTPCRQYPQLSPWAFRLRSDTRGPYPHLPPNDRPTDAP